MFTSPRTKSPLQSRTRGGYVLPLVMIFTVLVMLIGWGLLATASYEGDLSWKSYVSRQALYLAEAGAERAQAKLAKEDDWTTVPASLYSEEPFADGVYSVTLTNVSEAAATVVSQGVFEGKTRNVEVRVEPRT